MSPKLAALIFRVHVFLAFVAGGVWWALGAFPGLDGAAAFAFDILDWPVNGDPGPLNPTARFMSAIGGGILVALGVLNLLLVAPAIETGDRRILNAGLVSTTCWVVVDSTGSVASGAPFNVVFNAVIYAVYVAPILLARRA